MVSPKNPIIQVNQRIQLRKEKMDLTDDTHPEIRKIMIEGYRKMTPAQKLQQVAELNQAVQQMALARIREEYGNISEHEQKLRLAALWLNRETMVRVFNWDPEKEGY